MLLSDELKRKTNINLMPTSEWGTALHIAAMTGNVWVVQILLMNNASLEIRRGDGKSPKQVVPEDAEGVIKLMTKYEETK